MQTRPAARLIVINPDYRVLCFQAAGRPADQTRHAVSSYWYLPGGAVERGESYEATARRELWEETGIDAADIGPCVWVQELTLDFANLGLTLVHERFFPVRVSQYDLNLADTVDREVSALAGYRWRSVDEMRLTSEVLFPEGIADRVPQILAGDYPTVPLRIT